MFLISVLVSPGFVRLPDKGVDNATVIGVWEINLRPTSHGFPGTLTLCEIKATLPAVPWPSSRNRGGGG